jgi:tRNA A-37 threonylcarbamoyl transferase component Bud32
MSPTAKSPTAVGRTAYARRSRITERLLSSSSKVAGVGLVTAVATLVFTIWFRVELAHQSEVAVPLARVASELDSSINQSLAALRGWVAYGDTRSARERSRLWTDRIEPAVTELQRLMADVDNAESAKQVAELTQHLRNLKRLQWAIEDVARTPGNVPASIEYTERLEPLRRSVLAALGDAFEQQNQVSVSVRSRDALVQLARFRFTFTETDLALKELIANSSEFGEQEVSERLSAAQTLASEISHQASYFAEGDLRATLTYVMQEFRAYQIQVDEIVALRRSDAWNVARSLFTSEVQPLATRAKAISRRLAQAQSESMTRKARALAKVGYGIIALALIMGILSGGSLFVSFRLRFRVRQVMDRAKKLGQYVIEKKLGGGGMGEIYLARHAMLRRPTVIKLLRAESAQDAVAQDRFEREVRLTSQLTHPNTIEIFDYGRTPQGVFYYAMEYLEGITLQALVALTGPMPPARAVHILMQACGSLREAHMHGLLHRDIKPSNLMIAERGGVYDTVKVLDFGLIKELTNQADTERTGSGTIAGTPMYLAPEAILSGDATPQTDLYALGAVGYYLLTGTTVFSGDSVMDVLRMQVHEEPDLLSERLGRELPEDLEYIILACLAKEPADRPESAAQLMQMLEACDCGVWTARDAEIWWDDYGEAIRSEAASEETVELRLRSGLEVALDSSRT